MSDFSLSVVVPVYDEQAVLPEFHARLTAVLDQLPGPVEIIYVNDGSRDDTPRILRGYCENDTRVSLIELSRNFGKEAAVTAGLDHAVGDATIIIDADLQDPPEFIPKMIEAWRRGYDAVYAKRESRSGDPWLKKATAAAFYKVIRFFSHVDIPPDTGDFRLLNRKSVAALLTLREQHRFMKGLFSWVGYRQCELPYERDPRRAGKTKWSYRKLWNFALDGITSFTIAPLKVATCLGFTVAGVAFAYASWIIYKTLMFGEPVRGYPSLMVVILLLGGIQLIFIGVIGEYLGRVYNETKRRPLYFVDHWHRSALGSSEGGGDALGESRVD